MVNVFLLLGSNLGNRGEFLQKAAALIKKRIGVVVQASSVYETAAWGKTDEPDYYNQVLQVATPLLAEELLSCILDIEKSLGRVRGERWGSRVIDIDILFYGSNIINLPQLQVPHPRLHQRRFTLEPLNEIAPQLLHPILKVTVNELKNLLTDTFITKKL